MNSPTSAMSRQGSKTALHHLEGRWPVKKRLGPHRMTLPRSSSAKFGAMPTRELATAMGMAAAIKANEKTLLLNGARGWQRLD